jgi:hypothetical protein
VFNGNDDPEDQTFPGRKHPIPGHLKSELDVAPVQFTHQA